MTLKEQTVLAGPGAGYLVCLDRQDGAGAQPYNNPWT